MKGIRTQSKDQVIQDAARQGIKVYKWSGGYFTASAVDCARKARVSESYMRKIGWIVKARCGIAQDMNAGRMNEAEAYRLARMVYTVFISPNCPATAQGIRLAAQTALADDGGDAAIRTRCGNKQAVEEPNDALAEAVAEIRRLRGILADVGVDPDGIN